MHATESKNKAKGAGEETSSGGGGSQPEAAFSGSVPNYLQSGPPLIQRKAEPLSAEPDEEDLGTALVQAKMAVSSPDDEYEKEADAVADVVVQRSQNKPKEESEPAPKVRLTPPDVRLKPTVNIQRKPASAAKAGAASGGALSPPDAGKPLNPDIRSSVESVMQTDIGDVRVHDGPSAQRTAGRLNARAFTNQNHIWLGRGESASDTELMAHEATHVVQQSASSGAVAPIQRLATDPPPAAPPSSEPPVSGGESSSEGTSSAGGDVPGNMSMEEMEQRLSSTPADGAAAGGQDVAPSPETESRLDDVGEGGGEGEGEQEASAEGEAQEGEEETGEGDGEETAATAIGEGGEGGSAPESPVEPDAAATYESMVDEDVGAYLNGDAAPDRLTTLNDTTTTLLGATEELSQQQVSDPEPHGFLASVTGLGPLADAFTRVSPGYENEATWLQVVAQIRDICSSLGGVVGMIGLVATVSGLIMSLLVPPVGAFLLTAGRFCDMAALILDIIALVTGVILTGYNLYRLKNATDPEEKRRLLGMVRQDAMGTVMSGLSVATAVAPGATRALGRTRVGQTAGRALSRAGSFAGDLAGGAARRLAPSGSRLARAASAVGGAATSVTGGARRMGRRALDAGHVGMERLRRRLGRFARTPRGQAITNFAPIRGIRNAASRLDDRLMSSSSFMGRIHRESRQTADAIHLASVQNPAVRQLHEAEGRAMQARLRELTDASLNPNAANLTPRQLQDQLYREFSLADNPDAIFIRQRVTTGASTKLRSRVHSRFDSADFDNLTPAQARQRIVSDPSMSGVDQSSFATRYEFGRSDTQVLSDIRRMEADRVRGIQARIDRELAGQPAAVRDARIAQELNGPTAPAHWTPEEIAEFRAGRATSAAGEVLKTPHHTMRFADVPHLHHDPRLMHVANAPAVPSYRSFTQDAAAARAGVSPTYLSRKADIEARIANGDFPGITNLDELADAVRTQRQGGLFQAGGGNHFLFDEHRLLGHGLDTGEAGASAIFNNMPGLRQMVGEGLYGGGPRGLLGHNWGGALGQGMRQSTRTGLPGSDEYRGMAGDIGMGIGMGMSSIMGGGAGPTVDIAGSTSMLSVLSSASAMTVTPGASIDGGGGEAGGTTGSEAMGEEMEIAEPPPSPAEYSPEQLDSISQQREAIGSAVEAVSAYIAQTRTSIETNQAAKGAAEQLKERNQARDEGAETEKQDVADQQSKLEQSRGAQENMKGEQEKASGEAGKGNSEASNVQSQGGVEVEAKQEEPRSRSWLERAWDATAGAAWRRLVRPVINAARRKVSQVMEGINNFIMDMINQALGLDEIEAELNAGGEDITARETSLTESDTGLGEVQATSQTEAEANQSTADQADANVEEASGHQTDAEMLLDALVAHHQVLTEEEEAGTSYVSRIPGMYGEYFEQQAELESMPPQSQMAPEATESSEEQIGAAEVAMVSMFVDNVIDAELSTRGELAGLAGQSASSIDPAYAGLESESSGVAMAEFNASSSSRLSRANNLLARAAECQGMSASEGMPALEGVFQEAINIADELEAARGGVIQSMASVHQQALAAAGEGGDDDNAPVLA